MAKSKTFKATWLGDGDPSAQVIFIGDVRFVKGDAMDVPEDLAINGYPFAEVLKANPTFAIEETPDVPDPTDDEIVAMKKTLDDRGIKYRANISGAKLRDLIADTEPAPNETVVTNAATPAQVEQ